MQHDTACFGPRACMRVGARPGDPNPRSAAHRTALGGRSPRRPSKPGEWREAAGRRGQWELTRRAAATDRRGARVRTGLAGSKAGQGELKEATRSARGQGPWYRRTRRGDSSGGTAISGRLDREARDPSAWMALSGSGGKAVSSGGRGTRTPPGSGPRPHEVSPEMSPRQFHT